MINISNDQLTVTINEKGAELQSVQLDGLEYLWQADAKYWGKHSPVLFPVVGELRDGKYFFEGREYKLSRHGFARDKIFKAEQTSGMSAIFTLQNDAETLSLYPFQFVFQIEYKLQGPELFCTYIVENSDTKTIYFSAGGHPAFKVPLVEKLNYTDYKLEFNNDEVLNRHLLVKGLTGNSTEQIKLDNKNLHLQPSLFYIDAIVLKHLKSNEIKLYSDKDKHGLKFKFTGFPYFGIWAAVDAPFVCLEPWCGIADNIHHNQQLVKKEGINPLPPGESWQRTWSVELF